jgi:hypothetical protein
MPLVAMCTVRQAGHKLRRACIDKQPSNTAGTSGKDMECRPWNYLLKWMDYLEITSESDRSEDSMQHHASIMGLRQRVRILAATWRSSSAHLWSKPRRRNLSCEGLKTGPCTISLRFTSQSYPHAPLLSSCVAPFMAHLGTLWRNLWG